MDNSNISTFLGGSPASVLLRLVVVSFVVGLILVMFGFDPQNLYEALLETWRRVLDLGLVDIRRYGRIFLTGAMIVVPVWIILRLFSARRAR